jgi:hypothetical protein
VRCREKEVGIGGLEGEERVIDVGGRLRIGGVEIQGGLYEGGGVTGLESRSVYCSGGVLVISGLMLSES